MKRFLVVCMTLGLVAALNGASADSSSTLELLTILRDNGTITQAQYEKLKEAVAGESAAIEAQAEKEGTSKLLTILRDNGTITEQQYEKLTKALERASDETERGATQDVKVDTEGGISIATYDGRFSAEFGGRIQVDAAFYSEDKNKLGNGTDLRRARFDMEGTMFGNWGYELSIDFADGDADVKDALVTHDRFWPTRLTVGQFKEPFSLEELTSSKFLTFMERALPNEFAPGRNIGFGFRTHGEVWTGAAGVFGEEFDDDADDEGDEGSGLTGRLTYAPTHSDTRVLHFGAAFSIRKPDDEKEVKFDTDPESDLTDLEYVDTDDIEDVDKVRRAGLEVAGVHGPFSVQAEFIRAEVDRSLGLDDLEFDGWYFFISWFITGESRNYKFKKGAFGRVKPSAKRGAWEIAARWSEIDLSDGGLTGGKEENFTLGVNWYINKRMRFMANYITIDNDKNADADGDVLGDDDPEALQLRFQVDF